MILISNIVLEVFDGSTVASTKIYGTDKQVFINIGSGSVFNLKWNTPELTNDTVDYYNLIIKRYDPTLNVYSDILNKNIGLVNTFCVSSSLLPIVPEQYILHIYVIAYGRLTGIATSNTVAIYICKGSGTYVKIDEPTYTQSIIKRAIAFTNIQVADTANATVLTADGEEAHILDESGNLVDIEATRLLTGSNWQIVSSGYVKAADNAWHTSDIKYEVLVIKNKDNAFEPIEVKNSTGNYELLYTL